MRICLNRKSSNAAETTGGDPAQNAGAVRRGCERSLERCTTWAILSLGAREIFFSRTVNIAARTATPTSKRTRTTWPCRGAATRTGPSPRRCGLLWRTVCPIESRPGICGATIGCSSRLPRSRTGWRRRGKKAAVHVTGEYLDDALSNFSGYIAVDELYDGPFCVLSIVDNHRFRRLVYEVLDHNPTHEDITRFFRRFARALEVRGLRLLGITTDGSPLYPDPIAEAFGAVPHQICEFHVIAKLTRAVLKAVARVRRRMKKALPKLIIVALLILILYP